MNIVKSLLKENGFQPSDEADTSTEGPASATEPTIPTEDGGEGDQGVESPATPPATVDQELSDEALLAAVNKRRGTSYTSLDQIAQPTTEPQLTDEQKEALALERQNKVRTFALQNKKATSTDFDRYAQETSQPYVDVALQLYKTERLEALKASGVVELPEDSQLEAEFNDLNFQYADATDPKRLKAEARLRAEVDGYLQTKYANIYSLEDEFTEHESAVQLRQDYDSSINQVFTEAQTEFSELSFEISGDKKGEKIPYKFKVTPELFAQVRAHYSTDDSFRLLGQGKLDLAVLKGAVKNNLISQAFNEIISEIANAHRAAGIEEIKKGRRHIPDRDNSSQEGQAVVTNPTIKRIIQENKHLLNI